MGKRLTELKNRREVGGGVYIFSGQALSAAYVNVGETSVVARADMVTSERR